jgi:hypothetical protein
MRDIRRRLERLEAAEPGDPYLIRVVWDDDDDQAPASGRRIQLRWGNDRQSGDPWTPPT